MHYWKPLSGAMLIYCHVPIIFFYELCIKHQRCFKEMRLKRRLPVAAKSAQGPVLLTVIHRNSNSIELMFRFTLISILKKWSLQSIVHGTTTVLSWHVQKMLRSEARNGITGRQSFHRIWIASKTRKWSGPQASIFTIMCMVIVGIVYSVPLSWRFHKVFVSTHNVLYYN